MDETAIKEIHSDFRRTKLITSGVKHLVVTTCAQVYLLRWCDETQWLRQEQKSLQNSVEANSFMLQLFFGDLSGSI